MKVPFYTQHWNLDTWKELGYQSRDKAAYWERSSCGILCAKMAMDALRLQQKIEPTPSTKEIIDSGIRLGAYTDEAGWSHQGLAGLIRSFNFSADAKKINVRDIKELLQNNKLPIVSIKWAFRNTKTLRERILFWKKYGGHLALIVGFEEENDVLKGFYVHHTSKVLEQNWKYRFIPLKTFNQGYTERAIVVSI